MRERERKRNQVGRFENNPSLVFRHAYLCIHKEKYGGHVSNYARFIRINQAVNIKHAVHPVWFHKILLTLLIS